MKSKKKIVSTSFALLMALGGVSAFMPKSFADSANEPNTEIKAKEKEILAIKKRDLSNDKKIINITVPKDGFVKDKSYYVANESEKSDGLFEGKIVDSEDKEIGSVSITPSSAIITFKEVEGVNKSIKDGALDLNLKDVKNVSDISGLDRFVLNAKGLDKKDILKISEDVKDQSNKSFEAYKKSKDFDKALGDSFDKSVKDFDSLVEKSKKSDDYKDSLVNASLNEFLKYDLYFKSSVDGDKKDLESVKKALDESSKKVNDLKKESEKEDKKDEKQSQPLTKIEDIAKPNEEKKDEEKKEVNKSKLKEIIDEGYTYDTSKLSEENQKLLKETLSKLEKVYNDGNASQEEVDALVSESLDIKKNLGIEEDPKEDEKDSDKEEEKIDKTKLTDQIKKLDNIDLAKYNKEGQDKINELKEEAVNLLNKDDLTEEELNAFLEKLDNFDFTSYEVKEDSNETPEGDDKEDGKESDENGSENEEGKEVVDKTPVKDVIDKLDDLNLGLYNKEGVEKITDLKNRAITVFNNDESTKEDVDTIVKDFEELNKNLDSYKAIKEENKDNKDNKKDDNKNRVEVKVTPDKSKLKDAIAKLDNLDLSIFSKEKQDEILKVKADALKVYNNDKATEEEINKAIKDINGILDNIKSAQTDKTVLKKEIDDLNQIDTSKLSDSEKKKLETVKANALKVYNDDKATEEDVKKAIKEIEDFKKEANLVKGKDGKFVKGTVDKGGKGALPDTGQGLLPYVVGLISAVGGGVGLYKYTRKK